MKWISVTDKLPQCEERVLVSVPTPIEGSSHLVYTTLFAEYRCGHDPIKHHWIIHRPNGAYSEIYGLDDHIKLWSPLPTKPE